MGSPISLGDALTVIEKAISVYKKIKDAPGKIQEVGFRMTTLQRYLKSLQKLTNEKVGDGLAAQQPEEVKEIDNIAKEIKKQVKQVHALLEKWRTERGSFTAWVANAAFSLKDMQKLEGMISGLDILMRQVDFHINLLLWFGVNHLLKSRQQSKPKTKTKKPSTPTQQPKKSTKSYSLIFVDNTNTACSQVAEAYCRLVREWTLNAGSEEDWKVRLAHSAGLRVSARGDSAEILTKAGFKMLLGNAPPSETAIQALFDNKLFNYPAKAKLREEALERRSRGVTKSLFKRYDFVIVFDRLHLVKMEKLKRSFADAYGSEAVPDGKGKIVLLGAYGNNLDQPDISDAAESAPLDLRRKKWNQTVAAIKVAFKGFLTEEMDWEKPAPKQS